MADFQEILDDSIQAYRYKETVPLKLNAEYLANMARAARDGLALGMPKAGVTGLVDRILLEGRADAGVNDYNHNNPAAAKLVDQLLARGHDYGVAQYAGAVLDKSQVAKRLGITFDEAWNGTGKTKEGMTGKDYAARAKRMTGASEDPRNSDLVSYMERVAAGKLTKREQLAATSDDVMIDRVYGTKSELRDVPMEYGHKSNFARAYVEEVKKVFGTEDTYSIERDAAKFWTQYEPNARRLLAGTIRANLGINSTRMNHTNALRSQIAHNPKLQQVYQNLAEQAIQSLGIKPEDRK